MRNTETNILIVDDRHENLLVLEGLLEGLDCNVYKATSGNEALGIMLEHEFALVLLDVQMPNMDGFETAELMRGMEKTRNIPIIFVTAIHMEQKYIFKGYEVGAVDYIFKPIEPVILISKVKVFLNLFRQNQLLKAQTQQLRKQALQLEEKLEEVMTLQRVNGRLLSLSNLDSLTEIPNRRHFDQYIKLCWRDAIRECIPLSIVMLDIDSFKAYNDYYGHIKGDECIVAVAKKIAQTLKRPRDFVARYGGEEFVVVLPNTGSEGAILLAEAIRDSIKCLEIENAKSLVGQYVTASLGVASIIPRCTDTIEEFIAQADKALYEAKRMGRNLVRVY